MPVLNGFGGSGANLPPQLKWTNVPASTKSFALTVYDPDAPTGRGWWHGVVADIPPTVLELPNGWAKAEPCRPRAAARQTKTDFEAPGYGGPALHMEGVTLAARCGC